jgi:hypothetical protein
VRSVLCNLIATSRIDQLIPLQNRDGIEFVVTDNDILVYSFGEIQISSQ